MKRFIFSILFVSVFCVGLGALVDKAGAKFKSDERALALIQKARVAIGGDAAIAGVQSISIVGKTTRTLKIDGADRTEQGDTEIAMQLPDKLMKMIKIGHDDGTGEGMKMIDKQVNVVVAGNEKGTAQVTVDADDDGNGTPVKKIVIKKDDGTVQEFTGEEADKIIAADASNPKGTKTIVIKRPDGTTNTYTGAEADKVIAQNGDSANVWTSKDGKTININRENVIAGGAGEHDAMRHNEMLRLTLSLLITAPKGMDVSYTYGGEKSVDGTPCSIVNAEFAGATFKLYLGQSTNLPVMMTYTGMKMPMIIKFKADGADAKATEPKDSVIVMRKADGPPMETAEFNVKFSDYRSVGELKLPFKWTQTVGTATDEIFDVTTYDINPANIGDRFNNKNVKVRIMKDQK
jgi:hypothetical protein